MKMELQADIAAVRTDLQADIAAVRIDQQSMKTELSWLKWLMAAGVAGILLPLLQELLQRFL